MKGKKQVDICFVLDATESMQNVFISMIEHINDIDINLKKRYGRADFKYAAVIYRDPVDYMKPPQSYPMSNEMQAKLKEYEVKKKKERIRQLMQRNLYDEDFEARKEEWAKLIDTSKYPINKNVVIPFTNKIEYLEQELMKVKCGGGNDDPEDWVGALTLALDLSWREKCEKFIIWISDANAHGKRYCGYDNHNEEEPKLEQLVQQMAKDSINFTGISINIDEDEGCETTLRKMREIYCDVRGSRYFIIESFVQSNYEIMFDYEWPKVVCDDLMDLVTNCINDFISNINMDVYKYD